MRSIKFSVQAEPHDLASWLLLARRVEASGFHALLVGDHPGSGAAPWPALGAAAAVTHKLGLGTYVLQAGVRDVVQCAGDAATLNLLAPGRVLLGLGAGHTFREWEVSGRIRPSAGDRADRLVEFVNSVAELLDGGTVTVAGQHLVLVEARLEDLPADGDVRLVVGGGHPRILRVAAERADVVALSGLGRTRPDGHRHDVRWTAHALTAQLSLIRSIADAAGRSPDIEVLLQQVTLTADRMGEIAALGERLSGNSVRDLASTPFLLIGTLAEMASQIRRQALERGINRYVVRESAIETIEQLGPFLDR